MEYNRKLQSGIRQLWGYIVPDAAAAGAPAPVLGLGEPEVLRNGRQWSWVFEPVVENMLGIMVRDHQINELLREDKALYNDIMERYKQLLLKDAPQCLRVRPKFEEVASERVEGGMEPKVKEFLVDDVCDNSEDLGKWNFGFMAKTEQLKDGGSRSTQEFRVTRGYTIQQLETALRRWFQVLTENEGNTKGLYGSFLREFEVLAPMLRKFFDFDSSSLRAFAPDHSGARKAADGREKYVPCDIILPWNKVALKEDYPDFFDGLGSVDVELRFADVTEKKVALILELNGNHIRVRMNICGNSLVWSEVNQRQNLVALYTAEDKLDVIPFDSGNMFGKFHLVLTPTVRLPLKIHLDMPVFHVELSTEIEEETGDNIVTGRICQMDKRLFGRTIRLMLPGLMRVFERVMNTYQVQWRVHMEPDQAFASIDNTAVYEMPKLSKGMQATYEKMVTASFDEEAAKKKRKSRKKPKKPLKHNNMYLLENGEEEEEPEEDPKMDFLNNALQDLWRMVSNLGIKMFHPSSEHAESEAEHPDMLSDTPVPAVTDATVAQGIVVRV